MRILKIDRPDPYPSTLFALSRCAWFVELWLRWILSKENITRRGINIVRKGTKHGNT